MDALLPRVLTLAKAIQQIPAPTGEEHARAAFVQARWQEEGLPVVTDAVGNVYARVPGAQASAPPLVISAHLDTVFPADTPLTLRQRGDRLYGPGIGDNSVAVAALFGLWWQIRAAGRPLSADVWLVANVGEEGLGNLKGMKAVVARFGATPRAYVVLEGLGLGWVYHRGLGVRRYRVRIATPGGHAWAQAGTPSAVHEMAALVTRLDALPLPPQATLNVGVFRGGVSINTIAPEAEIEIDLRAAEPAALRQLSKQVEKAFRRQRGPRVHLTWEIIGERPAGGLPEQHPLVVAAQEALARHGVRPALTLASTDANWPLSRGLPAICLGLTLGGGAHTTDEYIQMRPLGTGLAVLADLVRALIAP